MGALAATGGCGQAHRHFPNPLHLRSKTICASSEVVLIELLVIVAAGWAFFEVGIWGEIFQRVTLVLLSIFLGRSSKR